MLLLFESPLCSHLKEDQDEGQAHCFCCDTSQGSCVVCSAISPSSVFSSSVWHSFVHSFVLDGYAVLILAALLLTAYSALHLLMMNYSELKALYFH